MKSQDSKEEKLRDELEAIYQRVAKEQKPDLFPLEQKSRPFFRSRSFLAFLAGIAFVALILAVFFWPDIQNPLYNYDMVKSGEKTYAVRTNRITGAMTYFDRGAWKNPPIPTPVSSAIPSPPAVPSTIPQPTLKPMDQPVKVKGYAIQLSAMRSLELAREFVDQQKKSGRAVYLAQVNLGKQGVWYRIYLGQFTGRKEAARYMREKKIKEIFPDSFIQRVSS